MRDLEYKGHTRSTNPGTTQSAANEYESKRATAKALASRATKDNR